MNILNKILASIIAATIGLVLIPILSIDFSVNQSMIAMLLIYFLPGFSIVIVILFELLTRIQRLKVVYDFIKGPKIFILFLLLLASQWILIWKFDPMNDAVFASQLATAIISAILVYNWLVRRWNVFSSNGH